jgi:hypothetical protein
MAAAYVPPSGKVYLFGGQGDSGALDDILVYDPRQDSLNILAAKLPRAAAYSAAAYDDVAQKVYLFGGWAPVGASGAQYYNQIVVFDVASETASLLPVMLPQFLASAAATSIPGEGAAYVIGGSFLGRSLGDIYRFDCREGAVSLVPDIHLAEHRAGGLAVYVPDELTAYLFGGTGSAQQPLSSIATLEFAYPISATAQSLTVSEPGDEIHQALLTVEQDLRGGSVAYSLSNDGGQTWAQVQPGTLHVFSSPGSDLRWRAVLRGNGKTNPIVDGLTIVYPRATPTPTATSTQMATSTSTPTPRETPTPTIALTPTTTPTVTQTPTPLPHGTPLTLWFQNGVSPERSYSGIADTYLDEYSADQPKGQAWELKIDYDARQKALLRFDLARHLPRNAVVTGARLELYAYLKQYEGVSTSIGAYEILRPWTEDGATWNDAAHANPWQLPGCNGVVDRSPQAAVVSRFRFTSQWQVWEDEGLTDLVQGWVSAPSSNHGVALIALPNSLRQWWTLYSSQSVQDVGLRPRLGVTFYLQQPTPTPTWTGTPTGTPTPTRTQTPTQEVTNTPTVTRTSAYAVFLPVIRKTEDGATTSSEEAGGRWRHRVQVDGDFSVRLRRRGDMR